MATLTVYSDAKQKIGEVAVPEIVAAAKVKTALLFEAVHAIQTNQRQGTVSTKTRSEVRGGGKKPYRQKGTGNARAGSIRSPLFVGGGQTFGPRPREWSHGLPKQQRRLATQQAVAVRYREGQVMVVDRLDCAAPKTKAMAATLKTLGVKNGLLVTEGPTPNLVKSTRNLPGIATTEERQLNALAILSHETIVFTQAAWQAFEKRCAV